MKVTATRDGALWRLMVGGLRLDGFSLVSRGPAVFRRVVGGRRQEVRTYDPVPDDAEGPVDLTFRDGTAFAGMAPASVPARRKRRRA